MIIYQRQAGRDGNEKGFKKKFRTGKFSKRNKKLNEWVQHQNGEDKAKNSLNGR